jgi:hypothetical protein
LIVRMRGLIGLARRKITYLCPNPRLIHLGT